MTEDATPIDPTPFQKILRGRRATGSLGIKDDLENAGAIWVDSPVVVDGNLISSRTPRDALSRIAARSSMYCVVSPTCPSSP